MRIMNLLCTIWTVVPLQSYLRFRPTIRVRPTKARSAESARTATRPGGGGGAAGGGAAGPHSAQSSVCDSWQLRHGPSVAQYANMVQRLEGGNMRDKS